MTLAARLLVVLALLSCVGCGVAAHSSHGSGDPVITHLQGEEAPYPTARIEGRLSLREGCLLVGDAVVFWPADAGWDAKGQAVTFGGDFQGAAPAKVGSPFQGGGGVFALADDQTGMLLAKNYSALRECATKTGVDAVVMAYPDVR